MIYARAGGGKGNEKGIAFRKRGQRFFDLV